jgi:hypothetical protein
MLNRTSTYEEKKKMTEENFVYWLQGFFELNEVKSIDEQQVKIIKEHLALVLKKDTLTSFVTFPNIQSSC